IANNHRALAIGSESSCECKSWQSFVFGQVYRCMHLSPLLLLRRSSHPDRRERVWRKKGASSVPQEGLRFVSRFLYVVNTNPRRWWLSSVGAEMDHSRRCDVGEAGDGHDVVLPDQYARAVSADADPHRVVDINLPRRRAVPEIMQVGIQEYQ